MKRMQRVRQAGMMMYLLVYIVWSLFHHVVFMVYLLPAMDRIASEMWVA